MNATHGTKKNFWGQCVCETCETERREDSRKLDAENRDYWAAEERRMARMPVEVDRSVAARGAW